MKTKFRRVLPVAVTLAGLAWCRFATASPLADSAVGTGTVLGNGMSASARAARPLDPDWTAVKRTPTGRFFDWPFAVPKAGEIAKLASGWEYSGQLEVGVIGGDADERNAQYRTYQDTDNGGQVNTFNLELRKPDSGHYVELTGGGAGRHDQYYGLQFGRYNDWKVKVFFSETPHVFTDRYKSLWTGIGTGNLILLPGLTAGGTASIPADNASVSSVATSVAPTTLSLVRKKAGVRVDANLSASWKVYAGYSMEKRKGARPFGAVWGNAPGTAPIEIAEPIDYVTHDLLAGLTHTDPLNVFNLRLSASIFENKISTLTFQEPYRIAPAPGVTTTPAAGAYTQGRFDLAPANQAYNARAEYTRKLPAFYNGYVTAVVSAGTWRQDDNLIPYTTLAGLSLANVTVLPGGNWDSTGALSRQSTDATVDTRLVDLTLSINPTSDLNLKAKARYHETRNTSDPYLAVNPNAVYVDADGATAGAQTRGLTYEGVTGVWGRLLNDGSGQNLLLGANANAAGNIPITNKLYGSEQLRVGPSAEYRLNSVSSVNASLEREIVSRENRQRDRTWEDKAKVGYVNRGLGEASLRLSYEASRRRGSTYVSSTYDDAFSAALIPIPTTAGANVTSWAVRMNTQMRALDIADRDQQVANVRLDTLLRPNLDAGISGQFRDAKYPNSMYGRTAQKQRSANVDLNYQPSPRQTIYGFYSYQIGENNQATIASANATLTIGQVTGLGTVTPANAIEIGAAPGSPLFPLVNAWTGDSTDRNHVFGAGLRQDIGKGGLNLDYTYTTGRTRIAYAYTVGGAVNAATAPLAGDRMPDLATDARYLDASFRYPLSARITARLVYRFQTESIRDWHYQNLDAQPVVPAANGAAGLPTLVGLDGGRYNYRVNWYGVMLQLKL